jgi:hypothetical protein
MCIGGRVAGTLLHFAQPERVWGLARHPQVTRARLCAICSADADPPLDPQYRPY